MASELVQAQIAAKKRLQQIVAAAVAAAWAGLPHYDQAQVDEFLSAALPITAAANRQAVMLTVAFLARSLGTAPVGVDAAAIIAGIRNGATPEEVYKRPFVTVWAALGRGIPWEQAVKMGSDRAVSAAVTDVQLSFTHTLVSSVDDLLGSRSRQSITYQRVPDDGACEFCETCAGQIYHTEDLMPIHNNCVVGSTPVQALGGALAATRRWYEGEVVVLETAAGYELTVTPNHPILTAHGWVAAGFLREGDSIISSRCFERVIERVPNEQDVPTRIEDRFRAGAVVALVAVPFAAEQFHGDIGDGEVHVVPLDGNLDTRQLSALLQPRQQQPLTTRFRLPLDLTRHRAPRQHLGGVRSTALRRMCGSCVRLALGGRFARSTDAVLLRPSAHRHSGNEQMVLDRAPVNAVSLRESQHGFAGEIALDSVGHTRRIDWSGHVFNLVTERGWYIANGIVTHNCGCGVEVLTDSGSPAPAPDRISGPDGLVVAVQDHGELGPVLTNAADHFTGPGDLPVTAGP